MTNLGRSLFFYVGLNITLEAHKIDIKGDFDLPHPDKNVHTTGLNILIFKLIKGKAVSVTV